MTSSGPAHSNPDTDAVTANQLTDYQFIRAPLQTDKGGVVLRCASGLGPPDTMNNSILGGWYFKGMEITESETCGGGSSSVFEVRNANRRRFPGIINLNLCDNDDLLSPDGEGVIHV